MQKKAVKNCTVGKNKTAYNTYGVFTRSSKLPADVQQTSSNSRVF